MYKEIVKTIICNELANFIVEKYISKYGIDKFNSNKNIFADIAVVILLDYLKGQIKGTEDEEPERWITTKNDVKVPVGKGENNEEACNEFFEEKQEEKQEQQEPQNYIAEKYVNYRDFEKAYQEHIEVEPENYKYNTVEETLKDLGIKEGRPLVVKTPIGKENITVNSIVHIVNGGGNDHPPDKTRFKSINKMMDTLKKPLLIVEKNNNKYYFKIFKSQEDKTKNDMVVISPDDEVYTNFPIDRGSWFFKQVKTGKIKYDILDQ